MGSTSDTRIEEETFAIAATTVFAIIIVVFFDFVASTQHINRETRMSAARTLFCVVRVATSEGLK